MTTPNPAALMEWAYAYGGPVGTAVLRTRPEDFVVEEVLGYAASGEGQHRLIKVQKRNTNTEWLARQLARHADVSPRDIGYAGMKDRNAVTTQWYSVDLAGRAEPEWAAFNTPDYQVIEVHPHNKKLRKGALQGNRFVLTLRQLTGTQAAWEQRLQALREHGVPNYFGEQRFGHGGDNLVQAWKLLQGEIKVKDQNRRGIYLSAARSLLFNAVLSERVGKGSWNQLLPGEAVMLAGSQSFFTVTEVDAELLQRLQAGDVHPSGPLWGRGKSPAQGEALACEQSVLASLSEWCGPLEFVGLSQERRPLRILLASLTWQWLEPRTLMLSFELPAGHYATSVVRELCTASTIGSDA